jgi:hypothetical protein
MKSIYHSHCHISVHQHGTESLNGKSTFLSTNLECEASIRLNRKTFQIEKARWEVYKGPGGPLAMDIEELKGVEAYFGCGRALRRALANESSGKALSLFADVISGVIQAETFIFEDRGFKDSKSYDDYWEKDFVNTCNYYSNLDRISRHWTEFVDATGQKRFKSIFNRFKGVAVSENQSNYFVNTNFSDSFHEIGISLTVDKDSGRVTASDCRLLRAPDPVCSEAAGFVQNIIGKNLAVMARKEIAQSLAGNLGCTHIIDLCSDLSATLQQIGI